MPVFDVNVNSVRIITAGEDGADGDAGGSLVFRAGREDQSLPRDFANQSNPDLPPDLFPIDVPRRAPTPTGFVGDALVPDFPGPNQVIIYQDNNRGGPSQLLEFGDYPVSSSFGLRNDSISAIDVGSNARAVLYQHSQFEGRQAHFEGGFYYDPIGRINNSTSSIEVFPMEGGAGSDPLLGRLPAKP
jgi:hypothetical protein